MESSKKFADFLNSCPLGILIEEKHWLTNTPFPGGNNRVIVKSDFILFGSHCSEKNLFGYVNQFIREVCSLTKKKGFILIGGCPGGDFIEMEFPEKTGIVVKHFSPKNFDQLTWEEFAKCDTLLEVVKKECLMYVK